MTMQKVMCKSCRSDNHKSCDEPENCLCADDDHKFICSDCKKSGNWNDTHDKCEKLYITEGLKSVCTCDNLGHGRNVTVDYSNYSKEPKEYEQALTDEHRLSDLLDNKIGRDDPHFILFELITLCVTTKHLVSKFDIKKQVKKFCERNRIDGVDLDVVIEGVWADEDNFNWIKQISYNLGSRNIKVRYDRTQIIEAGEWIKGNNFIKRIEITGDLLFYNGAYYEANGEAYIRRIARDAIDKPKTNDVTEVYQHIKDTCELITRRDIEHSVHIKCLRNGLYDINSGVFSRKFSPDYIILHQIPHNYDETAKYDKIDKIVTTLIPDKNKRQSYYDFISTCMHPFTGVDYQLGLVGVSGTGKSQLGDLVKFILGDKNYVTEKIHDMANDQTLQMLAADKMLNYDDDLNDQSIKQIDVIKKWVTQSSFSIRKIYSEGVTFRPTSRLMFSANDLYEIPNADDAEAIYDRTYLIRIDKKFRHRDNEVKNIMTKVTEEQGLDGLVTYLLKNATWIAENEKYHYPINPKTVSEIWNIFGNRISEFKKKWIINTPSFRLDSNDPFNKWSEFCNEHGYKPHSKKSFKEVFDELVGNIPTKTRKKLPDSEEKIEIYAYTGIRIKTQEEFDSEDQGQLDEFLDEKYQKTLQGFLDSVLSSLVKINTKNNIHTNHTKGDTP